MKFGICSVKRLHLSFSGNNIKRINRTQAGFSRVYKSKWDEDGAVVQSCTEVLIIITQGQVSFRE
jgi:hypothetical protein